MLQCATVTDVTFSPTFSHLNTAKTEGILAMEKAAAKAAQLAWEKQHGKIRRGTPISRALQVGTKVRTQP